MHSLPANTNALEWRAEGLFRALTGSALHQSQQLSQLRSHSWPAHLTCHGLLSDVEGSSHRRRFSLLGLLWQRYRTVLQGQFGALTSQKTSIASSSSFICFLTHNCFMFRINQWERTRERGRGKWDFSNWQHSVIGVGGAVSVLSYWFNWGLFPLHTRTHNNTIRLSSKYFPTIAANKRVSL